MPNMRTDIPAPGQLIPNLKNFLDSFADMDSPRFVEILPSAKVSCVCRFTICWKSTSWRHFRGCVTWGAIAYADYFGTSNSLMQGTAFFRASHEDDVKAKVPHKKNGGNTHEPACLDTACWIQSNQEGQLHLKCGTHSVRVVQEN